MHHLTHRRRHVRCRNCALTATGPQLGTVFANMCQYLADALLEARTASHSRAAAASTGGVSVSEARERFHAMCQVLAADFMPYASRCFHAVMQASDGSLCSYVRGRRSWVVGVGGAAPDTLPIRTTGPRARPA